MTDKLKVVEFPVVPLDDLPARLRKLADGIEKGEEGHIDNILVLAHDRNDPKLTMYGFGATIGDRYYVCHLLDIAKAQHMVEPLRDHGLLPSE